jgi:hypothetical protein
MLVIKLRNSNGESEHWAEWGFVVEMEIIVVHFTKLNPDAGDVGRRHLPSQVHVIIVTFLDVHGQQSTGAYELEVFDRGELDAPVKVQAVGPLFKHGILGCELKLLPVGQFGVVAARIQRHFGTTLDLPIGYLRVDDALKPLLYVCKTMQGEAEGSTMLGLGVRVRLRVRRCFEAAPVCERCATIISALKLLSPSTRGL